MSNKNIQIDSILENELKNYAKQQNIKPAAKELTLINELNPKIKRTPSQNSVNQSEIEHFLSGSYSMSSQIDSGSRRSSSIQSFQDSDSNLKSHGVHKRYSHDLRQIQHRNTPSKLRNGSSGNDCDSSNKLNEQLKNLHYKEAVKKKPDYMNKVPKQTSRNTQNDQRSNEIQKLDGKDLKTSQTNNHQGIKTKGTKQSHNKHRKDSQNNISDDEEQQILQIADMMNVLVKITIIILIISLSLAFLQNQWTKKVLFSKKRIEFYKSVHKGAFNWIWKILKMIFIERSSKAQILLCLVVLDLSLFTYKNQQIKAHKKVPNWLKYL